MIRNVVKPEISSSFLSCEKDTLTILKRLFVEYKPYNNILKRLLVINTDDCLKGRTDEVEDFYEEEIKDYDIKKLKEEGYIRITPKIKMYEHESVKSYILISFDNFAPTENPEYIDYTVTFEIFCHTDYWDIGDFRLRPLKIAGYIDGLLRNSKLSGIGTLNFIGMNELLLDETLSGYSLSYRTDHGHDDKLEAEDV